MTAPSRWPTPWRETRGRGRRAPDGRYAGPVPLMAAIVRDQESLPEAACRGRAPWFDADQLDGEDQAAHAHRLQAAASVCARCPEVSRCPAPVRPSADKAELTRRG